jgi:thioredoxin 1
MGFLFYWKRIIKETNEMSIELSQDNFQKEVLDSKDTFLIDFWGPQCKPCMALMPAVDRIEKEYVGKLRVAKVNSVGNRMFCAKLRVLGLPTFLFYKSGVEVNRLTGEGVTEKDLIEAIQKVIT